MKGVLAGVLIGISVAALTGFAHYSGKAFVVKECIEQGHIDNAGETYICMTLAEAMGASPTSGPARLPGEQTL